MNNKYEKFFGSWTEPLKGAIQRFESEIVPYLSRRKSAGVRLYPEQVNTFRAFKETDWHNLKVVILGQDPYHNGNATGLAFEVPEDKKINPSLQNIINELYNDVYEPNGRQLKGRPDIPSWAKQGVLMLNTALTVEKGSAGSHTKLWEPFTEEVIKAINEKDNIVWILWGAKAQKFRDYIDNDTHFFITSAHPSPFSADRGFFGSRPFSRTNEILAGINKPTINW